MSALLLLAILLAQTQSPAPGKHGASEKKEIDRQERVPPEQQRPADDRTSNSQLNQAAVPQNNRQPEPNTLLEALKGVSDLLLAIFTLVLAGATGVLARVAYLQWHTMKDHALALDSMKTSLAEGLVATQAAANAAKSTAEAMKEFVSLTHFPQLVIRNLITDDPGAFDTARRGIEASLNAKDPDIGYCYVTNVGGTEARITKLLTIAWVGTELPMRPPYENMPGAKQSLRLLPGQSAVIQIATHWVPGEVGTPGENHGPYVMGWIEYLDQLDNVRRVAFCREWNTDRHRFVPVTDPDYEYSV